MKYISWCFGTYHKSFLRLNNVPASVPLIDVATQQQQKKNFRVGHDSVLKPNQLQNKDTFF